MVTTTTYTNWKPGDIINICGSINEFCGQPGNFIFANDINVAASPNACTLQFGTQGTCSLHLNNVELTFKLVEGFEGSVAEHSCLPIKVFKTLGSKITDSNGVAGLQYTVTDQDRLDFESVTGAGNQYIVMACITNPDGQPTTSSTISQVTNSITIIRNLCYNVTCSDPVCLNNKLYEGMCNPSTGTCIADTTKLILDPCPTNYIEWDFGFLSSGFLDFLLSNIANLSNWLTTHLPTPPNIVYKKADVVNGKFRIFVDYTVPIGNFLALANLYDYNQKLYSPENEVMKLYNKYNISSVSGSIIDNGEYTNINSLSPGWFDWIISGINLTLDTFARIISAVILFMIAAQFAIEIGLDAGIIVLVIAAVVSYYLIKDINNNTTSTGPPATISPYDNVKIVKEFVEVYIIPSANDITPECTCSSTTMPTAACTVSKMEFYLGGVATAKYAQCLQAHANQGDTTTLCSTIKTTIQGIRDNLASGAITVQQACTQLLNNVVTVVDKDVATVLATIDCVTIKGPGWIWDTKTQQCKQTCNYSVFGQCLDTPILIGEIVLGGYIIYKVVKLVKK